MQKEKGVILEEIKMHNVTPTSFIYDILGDILHQGTVAGRRGAWLSKKYKKIQTFEVIL